MGLRVVEVNTTGEATDRFEAGKSTSRAQTLNHRASKGNYEISSDSKTKEEKGRTYFNREKEISTYTTERNSLTICEDTAV